MTPERSGAAAVEFAIVLPVFLTFLFAFFEFGHAYMTVHILNGAATKAARLGIADEVTSAQVIAKANEIVGGALDVSKVTVSVKDGSAFDQAGFDPTAVDLDAFPSMDLSTAEERQLFFVRITVPYKDVAILTPRWIAQNVILKGQSVQRHE